MKSFYQIIIVAFGLILSCIQIPAKTAIPNTGIKKPETNDCAASQTIAFINVNLVPMTDERIFRDQTILICKGRIIEVGANKTVRVPRSAFVIDGRGRYLMPGLADSHVHLEYFDREEQLILFLAAGVTTVRNMDGRPNVLKWRDRAARGDLPAPNIFTAGAILEGNPPFRNDNRVISTPAEAVAEVEAQKLAGYDFIKVYHTLDAKTYAAIIGAAKKHDLPVAGHIPRDVRLPGAIAAGQKAIEHLDGFIEEIEADDSPLRGQRSWRKRYFAVKVSDEKIRGIVDAVRSVTVWNVPTLIERQRSALPEETVKYLLKRPEMKYLPPQTSESWSGMNKRITGRMSAEDFRLVAEGSKAQKRLVKSLSDGGALLLIGTDTPNPFVIPGFSVHEELQNFVEAGLTPYQAIKAATRDAGKFMETSGKFGTIEIGHRADLILVDGNPIESVANLKFPAGVMVGGRWYTRSYLRKRLEALSVSLRQGK